ncbi:aldehyde dehydrogenase family protein, partial [Cribrihabitans sp. XS_ASV171]
YTRPRGTPRKLERIEPAQGEGDPVDPIDRTAKLYIGGKQARPDGGYSRPVWGKSGLLGHASLANRKDVRNAVEAATGAKGWSGTSGHLRAQTLYYIAENLSARAGEFAARIDALIGGKTGAAEVEVAIQRLFTAAAWADKYDGQIHNVPIRGVALAMKQPVGVIGALCADEAPLLGLISVMAPAMAMGNRLVLVASEPYPLAATDFVKILETSDVPAGVVNILTGSHADLPKPLASHLGVDAVWSFSSTDLSAEIEAASAGNLKRTWVNNATALDWKADHTRRFLLESTEIKNVWVPYGE